MAFKTGLRLPVSMRDVFPHGCYLVPDSITEAMDYNEATHTRSPARTSRPASRSIPARSPTWRAAPARWWSRSWPTRCPSHRNAVSCHADDLLHLACGVLG